MDHGPMDLIGFLKDWIGFPKDLIRFLKDLIGPMDPWAHGAQPMGPKSCRDPGPGPGPQLLGPMGSFWAPWAGPHGSMGPIKSLRKPIKSLRKPIKSMGPWVHGPMVHGTKY